MKGTLVIAERELPAVFKARQTPWILTAVAAAFAVTVLLKWPDAGISDLSGRQPRAAFRALAFAMLIAAVLVVPAFPATGIVREIRRRTMELLLNSPLHRYEIILGKTLALMGFVLVLLAVTLPAFACCYAMGGISLLRDVGAMYLLVTVACLEVITVGLLIGTFAGTPDSALRMVYGVTFAIVIATLIPWQFLQGYEGGMAGTGLNGELSAVSDSLPTLARIAGAVRKFSPVPALLQITGDAPLNSVGLSEPDNLTRDYLLCSAGVILLTGIWSVLRLNHSLMDRSRSQGIITDDRSLPSRSVRRVLFLVDPQRRKAGIPWFLNPVLVKEFRSRQFGRLHWLLRLVAACAVLSLLLTLATTLGTTGWGVERIGGIMIVAQVALIIIFTPGLAGGMIAGELETGGWDLLRVTPLKPGRILRGKLFSVLITLALVLCASLPGYGIMMMIKPVLREQVISVMICLVISALLSLMVSATVSTFFRTTAVATTVAYGILLTLFAGTMVFWASLDAPFSFRFVQNVLSINPMAGALNVMQVSGFEDFELVPRTWWTAGAACVGLYVVLLLRIRRLCQPD